MAKLDREAVEHVAFLARLDLEAAELAAFTEQLNRILAHMEKLNEVATDGVPPTFHAVSEHKSLLREDRVETGLATDQALAGAPDRQSGFFRVPRIIEAEEQAGS